MNSREKMLRAISQNKPKEIPMPPFDFDYSLRAANRVDRFTNALEYIGVRVIRTDTLLRVNQELEMNERKGLAIENRVKQIGKKMNSLIGIENAKDLETVQISCMEGTMGVAENGAIWINESDMGNRLLPFICQDLFLVVYAESLVEDMHEAYHKLKIGAEGYGVFIAGPSRTADIEQSLVIGAHGPAHQTVFLISND